MRSKLILNTSLAVIVVLAAGCGPRRPTGISMITKSNPPVFKLSGNSYFLTIRITPFQSLNELQNDTGKVSIWEVNTATTDDAHTPIEKLPTITYGTVPKGFAQFFPYDKVPPPPLEAGKFYRAEATATHTKSDGHGGWEWEHSKVCFSVSASTIAEVPCK
jgi:hypothetical protein